MNKASPIDTFMSVVTVEDTFADEGAASNAFSNEDAVKDMSRNTQ